MARAGNVVDDRGGRVVSVWGSEFVVDDVVRVGDEEKRWRLLCDGGALDRFYIDEERGRFYAGRKEAVYMYELDGLGE